MKEFPNETTAKCQRVRTITVKLTLYCHCRMPRRPADKKLPGKNGRMRDLLENNFTKTAKAFPTPFSEMLPPGPVKHVQAPM